MAQPAVFVSNQRSAYKVVQGAVAVTKTISGTAIVALTDAALIIHADTEVLLVQILGDAVWLSLHGETPGAGNAIKYIDGSILEMSRSEWLASKWKKVTNDTVLTALQLRAA